jgi:hypothetical protein
MIAGKMTVDALRPAKPRTDSEGMLLLFAAGSILLTVGALLVDYIFHL